jgi:biopolymer transport protein ExbB
MIDIFKGAGLLIYPLGLCSGVAVFIIFERAYALRKAAIMPQDLVDAVVSGRPLVGGKHTVLARIVEFAEQHSNDEDAVKAFARLELNRMERGVPYLDVIYASAFPER